jgi:uncharacterized spore protein YtfJ
VPLEDKGMSVGDLLKYAPDVIKKIKEFKDKRDKKKGGGQEEPAESETEEDAH